MKDKETLINSLEAISLEINKIYRIMTDSKIDDDYLLVINSKKVNDALQDLWKTNSSKELEKLIHSLKNKSWY